MTTHTFVQRAAFAIENLPFLALSFDLPLDPLEFLFVLSFYTVKRTQG